jgi:hypothetical protein
MGMSEDSPKPKRRWYRFSLLTLLVVVMTVTIVTFGGWVQYRRLRAQENRDLRDSLLNRRQPIEKAVVEIEKVGGSVSGVYARPLPQTWLERQFDDPGDYEDPVGVLKVDHVDLWNTNITNAGLEQLKSLADLQSLDLRNTKVTDAGLKHLKGLTKLQDLNLQDTNVTDAGLEHLKGLTKLQDLWLTRTNVTDEGLEHLTGLTNLRWLNLNETKVTDEGVKKLQKALPNCEIIR